MRGGRPGQVAAVCGEGGPQVRTRLWLSGLGLLVRVFLAWYVSLTLLLTVLGGIGAGFLAALILFPFVAGVVALYCTYAQARSVQGLPGVRHWEAFHHATIQVPDAPETLVPALAEILQEGLAASALTVGGGRLHALFQPPEWSGRFRRWARTDELVVEVRAEPSGGSTLEVWASPLSRLLYGAFWIDRGRNLRRLRQFQERLGLRLAAAAHRKEAEHQALSLEARLAQAELLLLRAQMEPHFLFNALAHLRELVRTGDTPASVAMLDHLIAYARSTTDRIQQATHRLGQELEASRGYLSLIQIRFGDRLGFEIDVDPALEDCEVPVGCLLTPLENAIKHGIEPRPAPGFVSLRGRLEDGHLLLEIQDDGLGLSLEPNTGRGTGLANLRERLNLLYADSGRLRVEGLEAGGVLVQVTMPVGRSSPT